jgi:hypothetical protein
MVSLGRRLRRESLVMEYFEFRGVNVYLTYPLLENRRWGDYERSTGRPHVGPCICVVNIAFRKYPLMLDQERNEHYSLAQAHLFCKYTTS